MRNKTLNIDDLTDQEKATWQMAIKSNGAVSTAEETVEEDVEETGVDRISAMLGGVLEDDRAYVKVQRVIGPNKYGHCDDYSVADYEQGGLKMIRETWGPGEYDIRLYGVNRESGRFGVLKSARVSVLAMRDEPIAPAKQNTELAQVLQTIAQGQQQMLAALTEKPAPVDPMLQMTQMLTLMATMKDALGLGQQQNQSQSQLKDIVAAMREMKEVSAEFAPKESESEPSLMGMLPNMLELIKTQIGQQREPIQQIPNEPIQPAVAIQQAEPISPQPQENGDEQMSVIALLGQLKRLVTMASTNIDYKLGAELIYEKLPDDFIELMASEEWWSLLSQVNADVVPHKEWLTKARDAAIAMFEAPDDPESNLPAD